MGRLWRWLVVLAVVATLAALPLVVPHLPLGRPTEAAALLTRMRASADRPYAGYAESSGSLDLPASDVLDDVSMLLGGRTQVRVWWRAADDWRVDTLTPTGEHDQYAVHIGTATWDSEDNRMSYGEADLGRVRFPRSRDVVPPELAARLLGAATAERLTALPPRLVAGGVAEGLRFRPDDPLGSIERVDVWSDGDSGIPVRVDVYGRGAQVAAMSSTFLDFSTATPDPSTTRFVPPTGSRLGRGRSFDLVRAVGRAPAPALPQHLLGYSRLPTTPGLEGVAQYGRGTTQFAVGVLPERAARSLRQQLSFAVGSSALPEGVALSVGPLALLLTDPAVTGRSMLLAGTLTREGLAMAAAGLRSANR
ncbi:MAG: hypothetical protein ACJ72B_08250 [Ornithinibacter sp.]